jgi:hypothetical protein
VSEILQHVIVTLVAMGAGWIIVRRIFSTVRPGPGAHDCASCPVSSGVRAEAAESSFAEQRGEPTTHPMILIKRGGRV